MTINRSSIYFFFLVLLSFVYIIPPVYDELRISDLIFLLIFFIFSTEIILKKDAAQKNKWLKTLSPVLILYLIFLVFAFLSYLISILSQKNTTPDQVFRFVVITGKHIEYFLFFIFAAVISYSLREEHIKLLRLVLLFSFTILFLWVVYYQYELLAGNLKWKRVDFPFIYRKGGQSLGVALSLLMPYAYMRPSIRNRLVRSSLPILVFFAVILAAGRAGLIAFFITISVFLYFEAKDKPFKGLKTLLTVVCFIGLFLLVNELLIHNLGLQSKFSIKRLVYGWLNSSTFDRLYHITRSYNTWSGFSLFPFLGLGIGFYWLLDLFFWHILVEVGVLGFLAYLMILIVLLTKMVNSRKGFVRFGSSVGYGFSIAAIASIAGFIAVGFVSEQGIVDRVAMPFWLWLGIAVGQTSRQKAWINGGLKNVETRIKKQK